LLPTQLYGSTRTFGSQTQNRDITIGAKNVLGSVTVASYSRRLLFSSA